MRLTEFVNRKKLNELSKPDYDESDQILQKAGYKLLGAGSYGSVYTKPGANYVLKVFMADDTAYKDYVKLCMTHNNPHFPKFTGKLVKVSNDVLAVRTEMLSEIGGEFDSHDYDQMNRYMKFRAKYENDEHMVEQGGYVERDFYHIMSLDETHNGLKNALDIIADQLIGRDGYEPDLYHENIMLRGNTVVITDPII